MDINHLKKFDIFLSKNESVLQLSNRNLGYKELRLISKIKFNQLQEINLSGNNIKNIEFFNKMNLPYLEYLNISYNRIENIEPIAELNSIELKVIFLQNNKIKDFSPLLNSNFPKLEILRIENNFFEIFSEKRRVLVKKFINEIITEEQTFEKFNEKYCTNINFYDKNSLIDLSDKRGGEKMLKDLYLIVPYNNTIRKLRLINNNINDASILSRIPLPNLITLDLSLNDITNLKFLTKMKLNNLKELYLNDNKINDISPLIIINSRNLITISLYNNNFDIEEIKDSFVLKELKRRYHDIAIAIAIYFGEEIDF